MSDEAVVVCDANGRLRIKVPARRRDPDYFIATTGALAKCAGVRSIESNPLTGSLLVRHSTAGKAVIDYAESAGLFRVSRLHPHEWGESSETLLVQLGNQLRELDARLRAYSAGYVDLATLGFALLVALTIIQLVQGQIMAPATTLLWYAASLALLAVPAQETSRSVHERLH